MKEMVTLFEKEPENYIHQLDITKPDIGVDITIKEDGKIIWVNVDGICILRICQIPNLIVQDRRIL